MARIDPTEVRARYGVDPRQVPDFIALRGDPSDKVPGAAGVGAVGAATLLERYGSLEATLAAGRFPAQAESLWLYRSIATMNRKAPLPSLRNQKPTWHKAADLARNWELNSAHSPPRRACVELISYVTPVNSPASVPLFPRKDAAPLSCDEPIDTATATRTSFRLRNLLGEKGS